MEYLHIMVPVAVIIVIGLIALLFWAIRAGQFDDLERQGFNILLDDDQPTKKQTTQMKGSQEKSKNDT